MTRYTPTVTIGRTPLASAWDGSQVAAVSRFGIKWGRSTMFEEPEPSSLEFHVVDPDGRWSGDPTLYDQRIIITIPDLGGRIVYQGDVTGVTSTRTKVGNPDGGSTWVWMTRILATAPDAALRRLIVPGLAYTDAFTHIQSIEWYGTGYWRLSQSGSQTVHGAEKLAKLLAEGAANHVDSIENPADAIWRYLIRGDANASAHEVVALGYRGGIPGGHVNYRPDTNSLSCGRPAVAGSLALEYTGGALRLKSATGTIVPARAIGVPDDGVSITSTVRDAIDTVAVEVYDSARCAYTEPGTNNVWTMRRWESSPIELTRTVPGTTPRLRKLTVKTAHNRSVDGNVETGGNTLVGGVRDLAQFLNGRTVPEGLYYDFERHPELTADLDSLLFNIFDVPVSLYFEGSIAADFPNHGPFFQIIGGTLEFREGWRVTPTLAPAPSIPGAEVTYANWVTNTAATYEQFADTITWADFAVVTQGAS